MPRASDNRGTCHADEVFDGQRWLSQAPGHGDLLRSTSDVQVCPYVPAVAGLRSRDTYGYLCTFACTWHCTWICTPTAACGSHAWQRFARSNWGCGERVREHAQQDQRRDVPGPGDPGP